MNMKERFRRWRRYQQTVRELRGYSPHELSELGIASADIGRIALDTAFGEPLRSRSPG